MSLGYRIITDADLAPRNTLHLKARARQLAQLDAIQALPALVTNPAIAGQPLLALGHGSNILFADAPDAVVLSIAAAAVDARGTDQDGHRILRAEAGLGWHALVEWTLAHGFPGLENLALIPGTVGAAPIQNIGAYGLEVGERIRAVEAWDCAQRQWRRLSHADCQFGYRQSMFKHAPERFIITAVEFALPVNEPLRLNYAGLDAELDALGITAPSARDVAAAVCAQRRRKLPDPKKIGNLGSFFKNPVIALEQADALQAREPELPAWPIGKADTRKLSAAWLIERCGWKGYRNGDAGVFDEHALVLVNHGAASGADMLALAHAVADSVAARFGIRLEPEPRIIGGHW